MTVTDEERAAFKRSEWERIADLHPGVPELLAKERRATVERIRKRLVEEVGVESFLPPAALDVIRILDEESR